MARIEEGKILKLASHLVQTQLAQYSTKMKKKKKNGISVGCLLKPCYHHEDVFFFKTNKVETTSDYFHFHLVWAVFHFKLATLLQLQPKLSIKLLKLIFSLLIHKINVFNKLNLEKKILFTSVNKL